MTQVPTITGTLLVAFIIIWVGLEVLDRMMEYPTVTYNFCCGGKACSDTWYDNSTNECVLMLCESNPLIENKSTCRYPSNFNTMTKAMK